MALGRRAFLRRVPALGALAPCALAQLGAVAYGDRPAIQGTVVDALSGQPVGIGQVLAVLTGAARPDSFAARIGSDGRFRLFGLPPGTYQVVAVCPGYVAANEESMRLRVRMGQAEAAEVRLELLPLGALSGAVYGDQGLPVRRATVRATGIEFRGPGLPQPQNVVFSAETDDRGQYRLFDLKPGRYLVEVQHSGDTIPPNAWDAGAPGRPQERTEGYAPLYYPDAVTPSTAVLVTVRAGETTAGIDVNLRRVGSYSLSGRVDAGATRVEVMVVPLDGSDAGIPPLARRVMVDQRATAGRFRIGGLPAGLYEVYAQTLGETEDLFERQVVSVSNANVEGVVLRLSPGVMVPVEVRVSAAGRERASDVVVSPWLRPVGATAAAFPELPDLSYAGPVQKPYGPVPPGRYRVGVGEVPEGHYLRGLRMGGRDAMGRVVELSGDSILEVILGEDAATLSGRIAGAGLGSKTQVMVYALPAERLDINHPQARQARTGEDGAFWLGGLAPISYVVFALEEKASFSAFVAEHWDAQRARTRTIRFQEGETKFAELERIQF